MPNKKHLYIYECQYCNKNFKYVASMIKHSIGVHGKSIDKKHIDRGCKR